jgi:hypothetical protein
MRQRISVISSHHREIHRRNPIKETAFCSVSQKHPARIARISSLHHSMVSLVLAYPAHLSTESFPQIHG